MDERLKILLIDDDEVDRTMARRALKASGVGGEFVEASDARTGIHLLSTRAFDVALLDHGLPDMDGMAAVRAIRAAGIATPVILLTGHGDEGLALEMVRAGANDYLSKQRLSRDLLSHSVRHAVRLSRAQAEVSLARGMTAETERRFRTMADSAPVLLWVADEQGQMIYFNQGWLDYTGRTLEQDLGHGWTECVHPEDRRRVGDVWADKLRGRERFQIEFRLCRADGSHGWVLESGAPRLLPDGAFAGFVGSCVDITARKQAEQERAELLRREQHARAAAELARAGAQASEQHYRFLAESIPAVVWTALADGRCDYVNRRWVDYTGLDAEASMGHGWAAALHPEDVAPTREAWERSLRDGSVFDGEMRYRRQSDGTYRWHLVRAMPLRDAGGRVGKWFGTGTDVEDQKRTRDAMTFLAEASVVLASSLDVEETLGSVARLAVPKIADWCYVDVQGPDGVLRRVAVAHADAARVELVAELWRRHPPRPDAPVGTPGVMRSGRPELYPQVTEDLIGRAAVDAEHAGVVRALGLRSLMVVPMIARGRPLGAITLATAETERWYGAADLGLAEDLARRAAAAVDNARLYREAQAAREVAEAQKRAAEQARLTAEAANHAKDHFLAVLSHELRTPLTPVLSTVQAIESEADLSPDLRDALDMIRRNVELEARLIDDLLDLTRISKGKLELHLQTVDAHEALTTALDICRSDILDKGLKLEVDLAAARRHLRADSARLHQVFWNLIKNAVKFTPSGGTIFVGTRNDGGGGERPPAPPGDGVNGPAAAPPPRAPAPGGAASERLVVEVRDTGIGIEPQVLPRIFDAFEQGERSITRNFGGLGLGLAISKALIDMQGGRLTAASAGRGHGATFRVDMAVTHVPAAAPGHAGPVPGASSRHDLRILLVDDHLDTALAMRRLLQRIGYRVTIANTVAEAIAAYRDDEFDLLISDIGLPDGSGIDLVRQLNEVRPVTGIALSGFGMEEDVRKSKAAGFYEHLTKPVNFQRLHALIREATARPVLNPQPGSA
jgi:PAS domain S-box-containing protein